MGITINGVEYSQNTPTYILDANYRNFAPQTLTTIAVEGDNNSSSIILITPRYYNSIDLSGITTKVYWCTSWLDNNGNPSQGYETLTNKVVSTDTITYLWTLNQNQTSKDGKITFGLRWQSTWVLDTKTAIFTVNKFVDTSNISYISPTAVELLEAEISQKQDKLTSANAGQNITITEVGGVTKINATGGASKPTWGNIQGQITNQTDLVNYVDNHGGKIDKIKVNGTEQTITDKTVDISVPTKTSDLQNDSGFLTQHQDISGKADKTYVDNADNILQSAITAESTARQQADNSLQSQINSKVDKVAGKGLSTNDFTTEEKSKLDTHVVNTANPHDVTKAQVGLGNVDNTSDMNKPVSTAQQTALDTLESEIDTKLDSKVDKITGKGLSTNDFTTSEKTKLAGLENYDDTEVKEDITTLETNVGTLQTNVTTLQTSVSQKLNISDVVNNTSTTTTNQALSANMGKQLQDEIDNLKARGRFLALWDCSTGLPESEPPVSPYTYRSGDYYTIGTVATGSGTNYKPTGTSYTTGVASTVVETEAVSPDDVYYFDGTVWKLQINTRKTVTFASIAGQPSDNTNLAAALNAKQNSLSQTQLNAVNSGIDSTKVAQIQTNATNITALNSGKLNKLSGSSNGNFPAINSSGELEDSGFGPLDFEDKGAAATVQTNLNTHTSNKNNPHSVTKAQVGLGNVDNTSDANKPVSTAQQTALNSKADKVNNPTAGNFAALNANGNLVDSGYAYESFDGYGEAQAVQWNLDDHTANTNNPHGVTAVQLGLDEVDNTSDLDKPISTATQTALNAKQNNLTTAQLTAVNSGIDSTKVGQITTNANNITTLQTTVTGKADKVNNATNGNFAGLDSNGNLTDSGKKASDFALTTDLPQVLNLL